MCMYGYNINNHDQKTKNKMNKQVNILVKPAPISFFLNEARLYEYHLNKAKRQELSVNACFIKSKINKYA